MQERDSDVWLFIQTADSLDKNHVKDFLRFNFLQLQIFINGSWLFTETHSMTIVQDICSILVFCDSADLTILSVDTSIQCCHFQCAACSQFL